MEKDVGILSGMLLFKEERNSIYTIQRMLEAQKHRDNSQPITYVENNVTLGMANR